MENDCLALPTRPHADLRPGYKILVFTMTAAYSFTIAKILNTSEMSCPPCLTGASLMSLVALVLPLPLCPSRPGLSPHHGGGAGRGSGLRGTAVSVAVTETAPSQTQLGHRIVGTGVVVAPLGQRGQSGEVDSQVRDLPQLLNFLTLSCWDPRG